MPAIHDMHTEAERHTRLVVRVAQDLLRTESFESYADLKAALCARLARLHIAYDATVVAAALDRVEQGGAVPVVALSDTRRSCVEEPAEPRTIGRAEAAGLLREIAAGTGTPIAVATIPNAAPSFADQQAHVTRLQGQIDLQRYQDAQRERRRRPSLDDTLAAIFEHREG